MRVVQVTLVCLAAMSLAVPSAAVTSNWNNNSGGSFTSASNWSAGVPGVNDIAVFNRNLDLEYSVTFPGRPIANPLTRHVHQLIVGTNSVSFSDSVNLNQLPASFAIDVANAMTEGALLIGNTPGQAGAINSTLSNFSTSSAIIGNEELFPMFSVGVLNVNGGNFNVTGASQNGDELVVGNEGGGQLYVRNGADVTVTGGPHANVVIGRRTQNTFGYAKVIGAGSTLSVSGSLNVGEEGDGGLEVEAGAQLTSGPAVLGKSFGFPTDVTTGSVTVSSGSSWTNNGDIVIGREGQASLSIYGGGQTTTTGNAHLGELDGGRGIAQVYGAGSSWVIGGNAVIGNSGNSPESRLLVFDSGVINVAGLMTVNKTGIVEGNSTITGAISNGGYVSPGYGFGPVEGALQINGDYTQTVAGTLLIEIQGTLPTNDYDRLMVSGTVALNGKLQVSLTDEFTPAVGNAFNIIDAATISGAFHTLQVPTLPSALSWNFTQLYNAGVLLVTRAGDFDADGDVDGSDFLLWQQGGSPNPYSSSDLAAWKTNFGVPAMAATAAVPEPNAVLIWCVMLCGLIPIGRSSRRLCRPQG